MRAFSDSIINNSETHIVQVCMVACHKKDLAGAKRCGLRTAYIVRPGEEDDPEPHGEEYIDYVVREIADLARIVTQDGRQ